MKTTHFGAALACAALLTSACSRDEAASSDNQNPLLVHVPADTAYVAANLAPPPDDVIDAWLARSAPMLEQLQGLIATAREDLAAGEVDVDDDDLAAVAEAVLAELDGKLNQAGLAQLGLSPQAHHVFYADGLLPVARVSLSDPAALRTAIARIEERSGVPIPEYELDGQPYWQISDGDTGFGVIIAILDDHLAAGFAPDDDDARLRTLLGMNRPETTLAGSDTLARLNRDKGYTDYGSGYLDTARLVHELFDADSTTNQLLSVYGEDSLANADPACRLEADRVSIMAPRLVAGVTELDANSTANAMQLELEPGIAAGLARLVADVPPASTDDALIAAGSLNLNVGRLREWMLETVGSLAATPFQCPQLQELNQQVAELAATLNQPVPPFIGNLKGLRMELAATGQGEDLFDPAAAAGLLSLEMESPQMVVGMAKMMIPGFDQLNLEPGAEPVELPQELMSVVTPEFSAYAVMSRDAIGLSYGQGQSTRLGDFLENDADPEGIVFSAEWDTAALMRLQNSDIFSDDASDDGTGDPAAELVRAYEAMMGRTRMEVSLDAEGITVRQHQSYR